MRIDLSYSAGLQASEKPIHKSDEESLKRYLSEVDAAIKDGYQLAASTAASKDKNFMVDFLSLANDKKHDLNAHYCDSPSEMMEKIKLLLEENKISARFVVNMGEGGTHFSAFEFLKTNDKISIVGIEPATVNGMGPALLALRSMTAVKREFPDASFAFIETDLQRSNGDCGMFSLFLVKKMLKEKYAMHQIHEKNMSGGLKTDYGILNKDEADSLIPPSFMKHTQSPSRLARYLNVNSSTGDAPINKKGETLKERQDRNILSIESNGKEITYSNSIELKRRTEIESLLSHVSTPKY
jgi:YopJ family protease